MKRVKSANGLTGKEVVEMGNIMLDCSACKRTASMEAVAIPRFNMILRVIGFIIVIPSLLGVLFSIMLFVATGSASSEVMSDVQTSAESTGSVIGATISFGFSAFIGASSLVGGSIGWLLLIKRKLYKCLYCGYVLERD